MATSRGARVKNGLFIKKRFIQKINISCPINPCDVSELYKNAPRGKLKIRGLLSQFLKQKKEGSKSASFSRKVSLFFSSEK